MQASGPLTVFRQDESLGAARDLDFGLQMLAWAKSGDLGPSLRLYHPEPTLAMGQRDANLPGFEAAKAAARRLGFEPLVRKAGGRAAAYHQQTLVIDHIEPQQDAMVAAKSRFRYFGDLYASALRRLGVSAAVGEIAGEYCPGEFSVHGVSLPPAPELAVKLIGTAQRVVAGAWLFSSVVIVANAKPLREVLVESYAALGLDWDPTTAGAADDLVPGLTVTQVQDAVLAEYAKVRALRTGDFAELLRR
ncbi:MAG: lipoate--protein ligase family protein [Acidobacteria bacterium]|nr:lipoate--protein ligase family protein [Acidobacteriota bacterium]